MIELREFKSLTLFIIVIVSILVTPLTGSGIWSLALVLGIAASIGWSGYLLVGSGRWLNFFIVVTASLVVLWILVAAGVGGLWIDVAMDSLAALMTATTLYIVLRHALFGNQAHSVDRVIGAASGYFLLALLWGRFYSIILVFSPNAIRDGVTQTGLDSASILYFSLVSLTTLGYGDIAPISPYARLAAAMEAGIGTLYLAIVIAALVGRMRGKSSEI